MSNHIKTIRGQLRQIVKELLPEVLKEAIVDAMAKSLANDLRVRMDQISESAKETMERIDNRSKDVQSYVIRELAALKPAPQTPKSDTDKG